MSDAQRERPSPRTRTVTTRVEIPARTIVTIVLVVAAVWLCGRLWNQLLLFGVATLLATAGEPFVLRLEARGWSRGRAVALLFGGIIVVVGGLAAITVPPLIEQGQRFAENLPSYVNDINRFLDGYPALQSWLHDNANQGAVQPSHLFGGALSLGTSLFSAVANLVILIALTAYLLLDGPRLFAWLTTRLAPARQAQAARVRVEVTKVVSAYVRGQLVVSALFGVFTYATLRLAGVPEPLLLAVMAALLDALPQVGATLATIPIVLLALTVSPGTALVVLALFVAYQQVENYVIAPRVFRGALQIPALAILVAVLIGGALLGVVGALLALPVAAAIPAVARAWQTEDAPEPVGADPRPEERTSV